MYQAKTGQTPPKAMQSALAAFKTAQLGILARGVANSGAMPPNLNASEREAVAAMVQAEKRRIVQKAQLNNRK